MSRRGWCRWVAAAALLLVTTASAVAAPAPSDAEIATRIERILASPEFATTRPGFEYRYRGGEDDRPDRAVKPAGSGSGSRWIFELLASLATFVARFVEALLWSLLVAAVVLLIVYRRQWLRLVPSRAPARRMAAPPAPVFGSDPHRDPLPPDIVAAALAAWERGDPRDSLSLLYRGALVALGERLELELPDGATEGEWVRAVDRCAAPEGARYFAGLTATWQGVAYARRELDESRLRTLCAGWREQVRG